MPQPSENLNPQLELFFIRSAKNLQRVTLIPTYACRIAGFWSFITFFVFLFNLHSSIPGSYSFLPSFPGNEY
jgi:hypothetical protein